ncbi:MAG: hypothetical protein DHS20C18_04820 [Saprospiraceae bacterium]|nr:MAG: hypothetical protein DHS20C18_04820 [Saprospiraceae bacterium]
MNIKLSNADKFLTEEFHLYYHIYHNHLQQVQSLHKSKPRFAQAAARLQAIIEAKKHNNQLLQQIMEALRPHAKIDHLMALQAKQKAWRGQNNAHAYLKDFRYMMRDWCALPEGESQVFQIIEGLKEQTAKFSPDQQAILFLGAGMGRIAFEHTTLFEKVYALDKSFSMVYHFNKLLQQNIEFYEINEFNVLKPENSSRKLTASIQNASPEALIHKDRFEYFVGDATELPFEDGALSCITSVYFTDVIALQLYFEELKRALKIGGLFIHFGPLDYFFSDRAEMLSAVEFREEFENNGFETLYEKEIELPHMATSQIMSRRLYNNWFFIARKTKDCARGVDLEGVYAIDKSVYIQERRPFGTEDPVAVELINKEGIVFEGAGSILPILEILDGQLDLKAVMRIIQQEYQLSDQDELKGIFDLLLEKGFIQKVS